MRGKVYSPMIEVMSRQIKKEKEKKQQINKIPIFKSCIISLFYLMLLFHLLKASYFFAKHWLVHLMLSGGRKHFTNF